MNTKLLNLLNNQPLKLNIVFEHDRIIFSIITTNHHSVKVGIPFEIPLRGIALILQGSQLRASKSTCVGNPL